MGNTQNSILLNTINGTPDKRPPFWFMRQAGRVLPSYQKLRERHSFWQLMKDPELASEVTLLPVNDLEVDAAILFSDILVIPYAMGMGLEFTDNGPEFSKPLHTLRNPVKALHADPSLLQYIYNAIDKIIEKKPATIPLVGFCGAPLTVLLYMLQGLGRKPDFPEAVRFIYQNKRSTQQLIDAIVELSVTYARQQIAHGVAVFQLFETHAGILPWQVYKHIFLPAVQKIARSVMDLGIPFIYFPKGIGTGIADITPDICDYLGIDWQTPLNLARKVVDPGIGLQGNIDPRLLCTSETEIEILLQQLVEFGSRNTNWILNLGHGFLPDTPYEHAQFLCQRIKEINWQR
jgi:uroporphyrinogen decarboxylase